MRFEAVWEAKFALRRPTTLICRCVSRLQCLQMAWCIQKKSFWKGVMEPVAKAIGFCSEHLRIFVLQKVCDLLVDFVEGVFHRV